jgi:hypothetical protein
LHWESLPAICSAAAAEEAALIMECPRKEKIAKKGGIYRWYYAAAGDVYHLLHLPSLGSFTGVSWSVSWVSLPVPAHSLLFSSLEIENGCIPA